jgi:ATP-dependent Clp protease ATP-binding subunit ClpC
MAPVGDRSWEYWKHEHPDDREYLTEKSKNVLGYAASEAISFNEGTLDSGHLLLGLAIDPSTVAGHVLIRHGLHVEVIRRELVEMKRGAVSDADATEQLSVTNPGYSVEVRDLLLDSLREALTMGHPLIGTEHILLTIAKRPGRLASIALSRLGVDLLELCVEIVELLRRYSPSPTENSVE